MTRSISEETLVRTMVNRNGRNGSGRSNSGRFNLNRGNRDPFWRKDDSSPSNGNGSDVPDNLDDNPDDIAGWIAQRAYAIYEERGKVDGNDQDDWFRAEVEIMEHVRLQRDRDASGDPDPGESDPIPAPPDRDDINP